MVEERDVAELAQMVVGLVLLELLLAEVDHRAQLVEVLAEDSRAAVAVENNNLFAEAAVAERKAGLDILAVEALLDYFHKAQVGRDTEQEAEDRRTVDIVVHTPVVVVELEDGTVPAAAAGLVAVGHRVIAVHCRDKLLEVVEGLEVDQVVVASLEVCTVLADWQEADPHKMKQEDPVVLLAAVAVVAVGPV